MVVLVFPACQNGWQGTSWDEHFLLVYKTQNTLTANFKTGRVVLPSVWISFELVYMYPRTRLVYFYFLRVKLLLKTWFWGRRHLVRLPWQQYICRSKYSCFSLSPKVTYLHSKIEGGLKFFISNFASLSWRIALNFWRMFSTLPTSFSAVGIEARKTRNKSPSTLLKPWLLPC